MLYFVIVGSLMLSGLTEQHPLNDSPGVQKFNDDPLYMFLSRLSDNLKRELKNGFPLLNLPPLDPLDVGNMTVEEALLEGFLNLQGEIDTLFIHGALSFNLVQAISSIIQQEVSILFGWENVNLTGNYDLEGSLISGIIFRGKGPFFIAAKGISAGINLTFTLTSDLKLEAKNVSLIFDVSSFVVEFDNLDGGESSGDAINLFLSNSLKDTFDKNIKSKIPEWNQMILDILNQILSGMDN